MTTIIGIQGDNWAVMAADSQITDENFKSISKETPKIIKFKDILIGLRGDARPGDIIAYSWDPPKISGDITKWVVSKMIPSMIKCFEKANYDWKNENSDYNFLISVKGNIFDIGPDLSISKNNLNIYGVGSGKDFAIGYVRGQNINNIENAIMACNKSIQIASDFDIHTSLPVQIELQDYGK